MQEYFFLYFGEKDFPHNLPEGGGRILKFHVSRTETLNLVGGNNLGYIANVCQLLISGTSLDPTAYMFTK